MITTDITRTYKYTVYIMWNKGCIPDFIVSADNL